MTDYGTATEQKISEVIAACQRHGSSSIIALAGVPGTGKSFVASIAAQRFTNEPLLVREVQFHPSFSYEQFIEGMRIGSDGGTSVAPGIFLDWNDLALDDPAHKYVLLIEELTRANLSAVLGELMTYLEYRDRPFYLIFSRRAINVARNLTVLATYNPADRSAINIDAALLRRLRIIRCLPDTTQLLEMLAGSALSQATKEQLRRLFDACRQELQEDYEYLMPFGHGIFAGIQNEQPDLHNLWQERIAYMLRRPLLEPHAFTDVIEANYPWRDPTYLTK